MRAVRNRQVQAPIAVEIRHGDGIAIGAAAFASDVDRGLERSVAVAQQHPHLDPASRHEIRVPVLVEVADLHEVLIVRGRIAQRRLEGAVAVAEQDPELMSADRCGSPGHRDIRLAVPVEVAGRD